MKLRILVVGCGILAMLVLTAAVGTGRAKSDRKTPTRIEQKAPPAQPATRTATPGSQPAPHKQASGTAKSEPVTAKTETVVSSPLTPPRASASSNYQIPWLSINSGGGSAASTNYETDLTFGQAGVGTATSTHYTVGLGFWYGAAGGCACDCHADPQCDGQPDVFDIVHAVDVGFRNGPDVADPNPLCPRNTTDVDCDGDTDVFDIVRFVNVAFRNEAPEDNFCDPCAP